MRRHRSRLILPLAVLPLLVGCPIVDDISPPVPGPGTLGASASPGPTTPGARPSVRPSAAASAEPGDGPTDGPTEEPTEEPADGPTAEPTDEPATEPTDEPGTPTIKILAGANCFGTSYSDPCYVDGVGAAARFEIPEDVAIAPDGTIYVADTNGHVIRKVAADGEVTTVAGMGGEMGFLDGVGTQARLAFPSGIALDGQGNLLVREGGGTNNAIRAISPAGKVVTLAGRGERADGTTNSLIAGEPPKVRLGGREGIALVKGAAVVADAEDDRVLTLGRDGTITVLAGGGGSGLVDGPAGTARFNDPAGLAADAAGNVYVADYGNDAIRKIAPDGTVTTLYRAEGDELYHPTGIALDGDGNLWLSDSAAIYAAGNSATYGRIQRLTPDGTLAVIYDSSRPDAAGREYSFDFDGIEIAPDGSIVFTDERENRIGRLTFGAD